MKLQQALSGLVTLLSLAIRVAATDPVSAGFTWGLKSAGLEQNWDAELATFDERAAAQFAKELKTAMYTIWKQDATAFVNSHANADFKLTKDIKIEMKWFNTFASKDACTPSEILLINERIASVISGIFGAQGLDVYQMIEEPELQTGTGGGRNLRGGVQRELQLCPPCSGSYLCNSPLCSRGGRRMQDTTPSQVSEVLPIQDKSPGGMEGLTMKLKEDGETQTEALLSLVAYTMTDIQHSCRVALKASKADIQFDFFDAIKIVVDDVEVTAEQMIAEHQANDPSGRRYLGRKAS